MNDEAPYRAHPVRHVTVPMSEARPGLSDHVTGAHYTNVRSVITVRGREQAVLVPYGWYVQACANMGEPGPPNEAAEPQASVG